MKKIFLLLLAFMCFQTAYSVAQKPGASPMPPLPTGRLLKRVPDYSTWTVTCQGMPVASEVPLGSGAAGGAKMGKQAPAVSTSTLVKAGQTIIEQNVDATGQRTDIWHVSGIRITMLPDSSKPVVCPDYGGGDIYSINFTKTDFAGLDWISASTYSGVDKYQGNDCIVFKGVISPLGARAQQDEQAYIKQAKALGKPAPPEVKVAAVALIDSQTRLPVFVQFGDQKRSYQYGVGPKALPLPPSLGGPVKDYEQKIEKLSAPASRPF